MREQASAGLDNEENSIDNQTAMRTFLCSPRSTLNSADFVSQHESISFL